MIRHNYTFVRSTALNVATAISISIPVSGTSDLFGQSKTTHKKPYKATAGKQKVQASIDIATIMKGLNLKQEIAKGLLMTQGQSNGTQYGVESLNFKTELKGVISDFLAIICIVPALSTDKLLIDNLETALTLVDYIPANSLFLMWKTLGEQLGLIRTAISNFAQELAVIPPLEDFTFFNESTNTYEISSTGSSDADARNDKNASRSLFNRSFIDLFQARIEMYAFRLNSFANLIPEYSIRKTDAETHDVSALLVSSDQLTAPLELVAMTS